MINKPEVRYELRVLVDDELVFGSDYTDSEALQEELYKADLAVEREADALLEMEDEEDA